MKANTLEEFIEIVNRHHNNKYDYSKVQYVNNYTKIEIICRVHGSFWQIPKNHYISGCKLCADIEKSNKNFIEDAIKIHGDRYDYSKSIYINQYDPIIIICKIHGQFEQTPKIHLEGSGCRKCYDESPKYNLKSLEQFIIESKNIHGDRYDYSFSQYVNNKTPVRIICKIHGEFEQPPRQHVMGSGCPECAGVKKLTIDKFIERSNLIHDNKYDYSSSQYINCCSKLEIICPIHGVFWQVAQDHLGGHGCHKCYMNISKSETMWLDYLKIPNDQLHRNVYIRGNNRKYKVDGLHNKNVYEFYGDFWHGNPVLFPPNEINAVNKVSFGELFNRTMRREQEIKNLGYDVISIWENDWKNMNNNICVKSNY
jgi:hypothetical protein